MTIPPGDDKGLEQRAAESRTRLLRTLDALERRGARLATTAQEIKSLAALVVDGIAVLGALSSLFALVRSASRPPEFAPRPVSRRGSGAALARFAVFAVFAGVAYVARRQVGATSRGRRRRLAASHLRAVH